MNTTPEFQGGTSLRLFKLRISLFWLGLLFIGFNLCAYGYDLPPLNLGDTSFLDGAPPPAGPGWYIADYVKFFQSTRFTDQNGNPLGGVASPKFNNWVNLVQFVYLNDKSIFLGGKFGFEAIIPYVIRFNLQEPNALRITDTNGGFGDIVIGPGLWWNPILLNGRPFFAQRFEFSVFIPIGHYNSQRQINSGSNFYTFEPYWSVTIFITKKWELTWRLHYLWNTENPATHIRAGDALHLNFASSYDVIANKLRLGVSGYVVKQFSDSRLRGTKIPNSKEQVLAIGPGALYLFSKKTMLFFNTYFEMAGENRAVGNRYVLRLVQYL